MSTAFKTYESQGFHKGRYWGVGLPLYYCPELEALRDERPIRECNEPHCRASDINAAHEVFVRRMTETLRLPKRGTMGCDGVMR